MKIFKKLETAILQILKDPILQKDWDQQKKKLTLEVSNIQQLEKKYPEAWVPLRLACSVLLTQQTNLKYVDFPKSIEEWLNVWEEICPNVYTRPRYSAFFENWLKSRGTHRFAMKFGKYMEDYWETRNWDLNNSKLDLQKLRSLKTKDDVKKWWMQFNGVGSQYAKNLAMDEMDSRFINNIKIDYRLSRIADLCSNEKLSNSQKEICFLNTAQKIKMTGWELDRFCFFFYSHLIERIS
jgi:hypothetical protein